MLNSEFQGCFKTIKLLLILEFCICSKIRKISDEGARDFMFDVSEGQRDNVAVRKPFFGLFSLLR